MRTIIITAAAAGLLATIFPTSGKAMDYKRVPAAQLDIKSDRDLEVAVFGGGCFWGVEGVLEKVKGVKSAVSGYAGGKTKDPTYDSVSRGSTGHAEAVRISYDPDQVTYAELLQVYFSVIADPTLKNRQGPDVGTQYRSALFPMTADQRKVAKAYMAQLDAAGTFGKPIVTTLEASGGFTRAEDYHQDFMRKNPAHPYIVAHDAEKVRALKRLFPELAR